MNGAVIKNGIGRSSDKVTRKITRFNQALLNLFMEKFNFTLVYTKFDRYGSLKNNSWNGSVVGALKDNEVDFSTLDMTHTYDRPVHFENPEIYLRNVSSAFVTTKFCK